MKKDLFDHIVITNNRVEFGLYRKMTKFENFCSGLFGKVVKYGDVIYVSPNTFKEFLKCLQKTKLSKNLDFRIREELGKTWYETSFNSLINYFVESISSKKTQKTASGLIYKSRDLAQSSVKS